MSATFAWDVAEADEMCTAFAPMLPAACAVTAAFDFTSLAATVPWTVHICEAVNNGL